MMIQIAEDNIYDINAVHNINIIVSINDTIIFCIINFIYFVSFIYIAKSFVKSFEIIFFKSLFIIRDTSFSRESERYEMREFLAKFSLQNLFKKELPLASLSLS